MKFVCMKCESFMGFENVQVPGEHSLGVTFACPTCGTKVAMVTNPGETAMVQALGVKLGGRTAPAEPMELTRQTLKENNETVAGSAFSPSAQKEMLAAETSKATSSGGGSCPFSSMVAQMQGGAAKTETNGTLTWTPEAQERLEKVPSFMRPMIQLGIESYAQRKGVSTITPEVMDASKSDQGDIAWSREAEQRLDNIPSFIRPMAKKEIERIAKERGKKEITADMMEETKSKFIGMGY
ncbi:MAG: PCP reductase family protein [Candidatus Manganitrophaceae bacterium]